MKTNPLISAMLGMLCVGAIVIFGLALGFEYHTRQLRKLQPQILEAQGGRNLINALADDAFKYSEHNPAIDPILQTVGVKPVRGASPKPMVK